MNIRVLAVAGALLVGCLTARPAQAAPILGAQIFATGGNVIATFLGHTAGFTNELYLFSASNLTTPITGPIFNNQSTPPGTQVNLGNFASGTELVFGIKVLNTGDTFFMGPASRNPDNLAHAVVDFAPPSLPPGTTFVGFEDLFGGGDLDFDDLNFSFTSVRASSVPEPSSLIVLGGALAGCVVTRTKLRRRRA